MKTIRNILMISAAPLLLLSCVKEMVPGEKPGGYDKSNVPIKVVSSVPDGWKPVTKAVSNITDIDNAGLQDKGFGVYAFYTGSEEYSATKESSAYRDFGLVLNNRQFSYSSGEWAHSGDVEFWPTAVGENLSLFAYAPWDTWSGVVTYDGKVPSIKYDDYIAQNISETELSEQRDILWGTNTSGDPHRNVEKDDYDPEGTVDFHFRHAVAKVRFGVKGSLPGEVRTPKSSGSTSSETGAAGEPESGESTSSVGDPIFMVKNNSSYYRSGGYSYSYGAYVRYYHAVQTQTETETIVQTRYRTRTDNATGATYSVSGQRYLVENVSFKGFNKTGTLLLDNTTAYYPTWTDVTRFGGTDPEYVIKSDNVLTQALRYVDASTVQGNFSTYTGIAETATDLMSGYFLYAIPREAAEGDRIAASIKYHRLNVDGTLTVDQTRKVVQKQTRTITRTRTRTRESEEVTVLSRWNDNWNYYYTQNASTEDKYTFTADFGEWSEWSDWSDPSWGTVWVDDSTGDWEITSETLSGATVNYNDDPAPELHGEVYSSLQGGRVYDINLVVAGDKIELEVVPKPWELDNFEFDYNANINDVIQSLTYDSSYIDYADAAGNVYINNRMGKFYFRLGAGKYATWQASLVGDAAFGFTDENGNFLLDEHGERVSSIRHAINPAETNYIYIKAIDSESPVTSQAKLRIYYIDATGDAVVALNLVNQVNVTEWTIVQNAN